MLQAVKNLIAAANAGVRYKKVGNHSFQKMKDGTFKFYYHITAICVVKPDGSVTYDNGGWNTSSTKRAISSYKQYYGATV